MRFLVVALTALFVLVACHNLPPVHLPPVQRAPGTCESACANMARLKCPEAVEKFDELPCATVCEKASQVQDLALDCVANAPTVLDLRMCRTVRCTW